MPNEDDRSSKKEMPPAGKKPAPSARSPKIAIPRNPFAAGGPLAELHGLGQTLSGLGTLVLGITENLRRAGDAFPEKEIGETVDPDYSRLPGTNRLVLRIGGSAPNCTNSVVVDLQLRLQCREA